MRRTVLAAAMLMAASGVARGDGAQLFDTSCAFCHQSGGVGVPGQFPRLAGRAGEIASKSEGKAFLPQVLLNGMSGRITVDGDQILGIMPGFDTMSDDDMAALLTYLTGLDHAPVAYSANDIKAARAQARISPGDMAARHAELAAKKIVP
ncbi:MAG TPA: cytochrome c [Rhizomicrobium sp.]|nr:cytochrome c [Rhizomicrobium sp.]